VLDAYFKIPEVWPLLAGSSRGTNVRRRRLHPDVFLAYKFPLPPRAVQEKLRDLKQRIAALRAALMVDEVDALGALSGSPGVSRRGRVALRTAGRSR
jgi:hypothetical protein